ncbi:hypothetical protein P8605_16835, partial [Streptomyces sp. T-3]|nr:hypothetical protein [Streptomyces sp. T-3]
QIYIEGADPQPPDRIAFEDGQEILLVAGRQRTVLRVATTRALPPGGDPHRHDAVEEGWRVFFEQLRFLLERRPGERRHTLYLTGRAGGRELLELIESAADKEVWHSSRYALLSVDREENLITAATKEPITTDRPGPVSVTVNGYGLDAPSRTALRERWLARWQVADAAITP